VRAAGSDVAASSLLLPAGVALGPGELALLAGCGHSVVYVRRAPRVAILCTGDELVPVGAWPQRGQVISANGLMLAWQAREAGAEVIDLGIARDDPDDLRAALERGISGEADVLVTCGGISVGDHDLVLPTLIGLGASLVFRRVRLRPGRPTTMLEAPHSDRPAVPVFALPGNPASAHVAFELFVRPVLRRLSGHLRWQRPQREVVLTEACPRDPRRAHVIRAVVAGDEATPLPDQTSGALRSIAGHNALIELASGTGPAEAGTRVTALLVREA
ncbi:MAG TPA: molybdopterin molybdotransferase MoeA, partial [Nannocystis sp.]